MPLFLIKLSADQSGSVSRLPMRDLQVKIACPATIASQFEIAGQSLGVNQPPVAPADHAFARRFLPLRRFALKASRALALHTLGRFVTPPTCVVPMARPLENFSPAAGAIELAARWMREGTLIGYIG